MSLYLGIAFGIIFTVIGFDLIQGNILGAILCLPMFMIGCTVMNEKTKVRS